MHYVIILYIESKKMYIENFQFFYRYYCLIAEGYKIWYKLYMSFWLSFYIFLNVRKALFYRLYGHFSFVVNLTYLGLSSYIFSIKRG